MDNNEQKFNNHLLKLKEDLFRITVVKASKQLRVSVPQVVFWDVCCPEEEGDTIAHIHLDIKRICISRNRLRSLSDDEIKDTAVHEVTHLLHADHGSGFYNEKTDAEMNIWIYDHTNEEDEEEDDDEDESDEEDE